MRLRRLRVEQLRQFREPLQIEHFEPGLNVISGPNESGKSTLVRAIRAAFFERYKSNSVADLQPWGDSSATPSVSLAFEADGKQWQLDKRFLKKKRCDLSVDGELFSGDEAEEKLSRFMGYQLPNRGSSKSEHWGIPGLLWIEQGEGQDVRQAVVSATDHIQTALSSMVGDVSSSHGDRIIEQVSKARSQWLTATGKPAREYAQVIAQREQLQQDLKELDSSLYAYQQSVDQLERLKQSQKKDELRPWEEFREKQQQAQQRLTEIEKLESLQTQDQAALKNSELTLSTLRERLTEEQAQRDKLVLRESEVEQRKIDVEQCSNDLEAATKLLAERQQQWESADQSRRRVTLIEQRKQILQLIEVSGEKIQQLADRLQQARQIHRQLNDTRQSIEAIRISPDDVRQLTHWQSQLQSCEIRMEAIATEVTVALKNDHSVVVDGKTMTEDQQFQLLKKTQLHIPGVADITIKPGGKDIGALMREADGLGANIQQMLQKIGLPSVDDVRRRQEQARELKSDVDLLTVQMQGLAPQGLTALENELTSLNKNQQSWQSQLDNLPAPELADSLGTVEQADAALAEADGLLKQAERESHRVDTQCRLAQQAYQSAEVELQSLMQQLDSKEAQLKLSRYQEQLQTQLSEVERLKQQLSVRSRQIEAGQPDALRNDVERFEIAATNLLQQAQQRRESVRELQIRLEEMGAKGLEEQRNAKSAELESALQRERQLGRQAEALDLLQNLLQEKKSQLTQKLQQPLQIRIRHYLRLLLPEAELQVDENLIPHQLVRQHSQGVTHDEIDQLSFGAREQTSLITRFAYADLLQSVGRPTLVILDDALVHSDEQRLDLMKRVIHDAAKRHQIILFTCHPEKWSDMAAVFELPPQAR